MKTRKKILLLAGSSRKHFSQLNSVPLFGTFPAEFSRNDTFPHDFPGQEMFSVKFKDPSRICSEYVGRNALRAWIGMI